MFTCKCFYIAYTTIHTTTNHQMLNVEKNCMNMFACVCCMAVCVFSKILCKILVIQKVTQYFTKSIFGYQLTH